ncbi:MAG TPA: hypothetical protein IAC27_04195 [Candidatus Enterenecus avicola]|nr:hypothetical protein [Candidatus Enterenecus avicola]
MQENRHLFPSKGPHKLGPRLLMVLVIVLVLCAAGSTVAWLTVKDDTENTFSVGTASVQVQETFPEPYTEKKDVSIKNTGDVPVYIRAAVSIYWKAEDGSVVAQAPVEDRDYTIAWGSSPNWVQHGDLYYYLLPVDAEASTDPLIDRCTQLDVTADGKALVVDVLAQAIQAVPADAVQEAWGVTVGEQGQLNLDAAP